MNSVHFCTEEMLDRFQKFGLISDYVRSRREEIAEYNAERAFDSSLIINGRRMTNLGTFRAYVAAYLRSHPKVRQDMTFLVRHLAPTEHGLPIEIYVFSSDQVWANYEAIQADIFDHLLAALPQFGLRVFQYPTGTDVQAALGSIVRPSPSSGQLSRP
jgi:miniconductance mechanosensitive channel